MDLAAATGARATRMSRLCVGDAAGGRGPEPRRATGPTTTRPPGAGQRVSLGARDWESIAHKLALLKLSIASWKWCPLHQAGLDLFAHLAYPVEFTYHLLPAIPFPAT